MDISVAVSVVESYIHHRKDKLIKIDMQQVLAHPIQLMLLQNAYEHAVNWFRNNGGSIEQMG